jgi:hypothetical protein
MSGIMQRTMVVVHLAIMHRGLEVQSTPVRSSSGGGLGADTLEFAT